MFERISAMAKNCKKRGGSCPCMGKCQAIGAIDNALADIASKQRELGFQKSHLESIGRRLLSAPVNIKEGFRFDPDMTPVVVFDGEEAIFGYADDAGDFFPEDVWPFDQEYIWQDDCERLGIDVEVV